MIEHDNKCERGGEGCGCSHRAEAASAGIAEKGDKRDPSTASHPPAVAAPTMAFQEWWQTQHEALSQWSAYDAAENGWNAAMRERLYVPGEDKGTVKILSDLLDRAYKMHVMAGTATYISAQDGDQNDPLLAWLSDVRSVLYGTTKPEPTMRRGGISGQSK